MKKTILNFMLALSLVFAACAFGAQTGYGNDVTADAATIVLAEETDGSGGEEQLPDENEPSENPDGSGEEEGDPSETPDGGEGEEKPEDPPAEKPEEPAAPLDTSLNTLMMGIVVLGIVALCAVLTAVLAICGKRKTSKKQKNG